MGLKFIRLRLGYFLVLRKSPEPEYILTGHASHPEVEGTIGQFDTTSDASIYLVEDEQDVAELQVKNPDNFTYVTQNRQDAARQLALEYELVLVVGSPNSSNSNRLRELAERCGASAQLIDGAADIDPAWLNGKQSIGITAVSVHCKASFQSLFPLTNLVSINNTETSHDSSSSNFT